MIGITVLDSLDTFELIKITYGLDRIEIPEKTKRQLSLDPNQKPKLQNPLKMMSQDKIITLCKMEIESRFGWDYLRQKIDSHTKKGDCKDD